MFQATLIRLSEETLQALKIEAVKENKSLSALIREAVEKTYGDRLHRGRKEIRSKKDPFLSLSGLCATGIKDGALHHDRDVYGVGS